MTHERGRWRARAQTGKVAGPTAVEPAMSPSETVRVRVEAGRAEVRLNRPDKHNGMNLAMLAAVTDCVARLRRDRGLRSVVIAGNGPSFCAGLDFASVMARPLIAAPALARLWLPRINRFQRWSLGWRDIGAPVIAAIRGHCLGAGLQLALGADVRVARPDARLSIMETRWGLVPDMGGAVLLRELVGIDTAKELTLSARILDGREAQRLGLVTHLADEPEARAHELADRMSRHSPDAVAAGKFLLQDAWQAGTARAAAAERRWQRRLIGRINQRISMRRKDASDGSPFRRRRIRR
ncbi:enoyl-CoA hydratase [Salinisphaera orenii YIM 95161]|uniref:Enoyl-CoA hydratase n=2 Tax=Salinisphaera TaxID=180541 RepID=A0A423QB36_9GAMM|nr:enoyl-CoA hydratase [Salinisphaera halophila YIM 95161]